MQVLIKFFILNSQIFNHTSQRINLNIILRLSYFGILNLFLKCGINPSNTFFFFQKSDFKIFEKTSFFFSKKIKFLLEPVIIVIQGFNHLFFSF
jgi:hypothetical protein